MKSVLLVVSQCMSLLKCFLFSYLVSFLLFLQRFQGMSSNLGDRKKYAAMGKTRSYQIFPAKIFLGMQFPSTYKVLTPPAQPIPPTTFARSIGE